MVSSLLTLSYPPKILVDDELKGECLLHPDWSSKFEVPGYLANFPPSLLGGDFKRYVALNLVEIDPIRLGVFSIPRFWTCTYCSHGLKQPILNGPRQCPSAKRSSQLTPNLVNPKQCSYNIPKRNLGSGCSDHQVISYQTYSLFEL